MEEKRRSKRAKPLEEGSWDCSVCTYKNPSEAFKCEMCDVRKGTSTRKPRLNQQLVAQQAAQQFPPPPAKKERTEKSDREKGEKKEGEERDLLFDGAVDKDLVRDHKEHKEKGPSSSHAKRKTSRPPRLRNIDRSSGTSMEVTVDDVTVIITDYKPKKRESHPNASATSLNNTANMTAESPTATSSCSKELNSSTQSSPEAIKSPVTNSSISPVSDTGISPKTAKTEITDEVKET